MATFYIESPNPPKPDYSDTRPPNSRIGAIFWRYKIWFEGTFVLSVLEYWEKLVVSEYELVFDTGFVIYTHLVPSLMQYLFLPRSSSYSRSEYSIMFLIYS